MEGLSVLLHPRQQNLMLHVETFFMGCFPFPVFTLVFPFMYLKTLLCSVFTLDEVGVAGIELYCGRVSWELLFVVPISLIYTDII